MKSRASSHHGGATIRQILPVKAEPITPDDFDQEANIEAQDYARARLSEAHRESVKAENKKRKIRGLDALPLPRKVKYKRLERGEGEAEESGTSHSEEGSNDIARSSKNVGRGQGGGRRLGDDFTYEGQKRLPYNPLYELAGLPEPGQREVQREHAKTRLVERMQLDTSARPASPPGPPIRERTFALKQESDITNTAEAVEENEEAEEGVYDDGVVVVPWGHSMGQVEDAGEEEEGRYSDDDQIGPSTESVTGLANDEEPIQRSLNEEVPDGTPSYRPQFPFSAEQARIGALVLDNKHSGVEVPAVINRFLRAYQREGVEFLYGKYRQGTGGVLGDDMGLGKTIQVISFLSAIMRKTGTSADFQRRKRLIRSSSSNISPKHWPTALIVCPNTLVSNWERELDTWGFFEFKIWRSETSAEPRSLFRRGFLDLLIVSFETARNTIESLKELPFSVVIVDEAHRMKEPKGQLALAMKKIQCASCFALTGTLVQNRMEEMWSILDFVDRGRAGTLRQWREFAVNPIKKGHRHEGTTDVVVMAIMRLGIMHKKILPHFQLRRDKRLIAHELPAKRDMVVFCPLAERQIQAYQAFIASDDVQFILRRKELCGCGSDLRRMACCHKVTLQGETYQEVMLKSINSAIKISNHFGLLYQAKDDSEKTRDVNKRLFKICTGEEYDAKTHNVVAAALDPGNCGKWILLKELLRDWREENVANKVIVFSNSVRLLKMVAEFIATSFSGFAYDLLTGEVERQERQEMVDNFQDPSKDHYILLVSTLAGGVGLNLTAANKVVIFDPSWNPANDLQAMDRAFRIGQKRPVDVYRLIGRGTVEELTYERQIYKQQRARQLNDGTFERRTHQGYEGATRIEDQGELFGAHNIFRFDPEGFVSKNLERVRLAEDRFLQDLIDAEFMDDAEGDEGEVGWEMRDERKAKAMATYRGKRDEVADVIEREYGRPRTDPIKALHLETHAHDAAFRDSPEERAIYEIGLKLLAQNPELAKTIKANDLGKIGSKLAKTTAKQEKGKERVGTDPNEEPWLERVMARRQTRELARLSDED